MDYIPYISSRLISSLTVGEINQRFLTIVTIIIGKLLVPLGWYPSCLTLQGALQKRIRYKYPLYKVYMGLIIKGTIPRVPPFSLWHHFQPDTCHEKIAFWEGDFLASVPRGSPTTNEAIHYPIKLDGISIMMGLQMDYKVYIYNMYKIYIYYIHIIDGYILDIPGSLNLTMF